MRMMFRTPIVSSSFRSTIISSSTSTSTTTVTTSSCNERTLFTRSSSNNNNNIYYYIRLNQQQQQQQRFHYSRLQQQERRQRPISHPSSSSSHRTASSSSSSYSSSSSSSSATKSISWMEWYEQQLSTNPILTKMITGSFLWGIGDMVAQLIPQISSSTSSTSTTGSTDNENDTTTTTTSSSSSSSSLPLTYDYIRTGRAALFGCVIHAPMSHVHYNFLEYITVQMKFTGYYIPIFKAFMEQFVYWSWISNSIYFAAMGAMQGMNLSQIYQRIYDVLWETQVAQWTFWIPIQLINFQYTPVRHQLNVVLITSIVWTALLSMWYPPIQKDKEEEPKSESTSENAAVVPK